MATEDHSTLVPANVVSPLMSVVEFDGQLYYTSQYFHRQYITQSPHGGKYRAHKHFRDTIRRMENYEMHKSFGDILELPWDHIKAGPADISGRLKPLFQAAGFFPLILREEGAYAAIN